MTALCVMVFASIVALATLPTSAKASPQCPPFSQALTTALYVMVSEENFKTSERGARARGGAFLPPLRGGQWRRGARQHHAEDGLFSRGSLWKRVTAPDWPLPGMPGLLPGLPGVRAPEVRAPEVRVRQCIHGGDLSAEKYP